MGHKVKVSKKKAKLRRDTVAPLPPVKKRRRRGREKRVLTPAEKRTSRSEE